MLTAALTDDDIARLTARLSAEDDVLVAYLYGSQARGTAGPLSDVDVAALLREPIAPTRLAELTGVVAEATGTRRADVVLLNDAPPALGYRVIRDGRVLICRDDRARVRHAATVIDRYLDTAPLRRALADGLAHRLAEGRFGRP